MRTMVVGDIHGSLKGLIQALKRCGYSPEEDRIIFLGDYVDGWSESAELIQFLIDLNKDAVHKHIFIRGNHDVWCAEWLNFGVAKNMWLQQGGQATCESYIRTGHLMNQEHRQFFKSLNNYYKDDQDRVFVHGGYVSRKGIGHDQYQANYYWDRDLWGLALAAHMDKDQFRGIKNYLRFYKHKEVYIGHTATTEFDIDTPMNKCNVWNMDTGAGYKGKLTIMDIDTKEYWQSDLSSTLYPEEKGR